MTLTVSTRLISSVRQSRRPPFKLPAAQHKSVMQPEAAQKPHLLQISDSIANLSDEHKIWLITKFPYALSLSIALSRSAIQLENMKKYKTPFYIYQTQE